jgi:hypothetical protein
MEYSSFIEDWTAGGGVATTRIRQPRRPLMGWKFLVEEQINSRKCSGGSLRHASAFPFVEIGLTAYHKINSSGTEKVSFNTFPELLFESEIRPIGLEDWQSLRISAFKTLLVVKSTNNNSNHGISSGVIYASGVISTSGKKKS